jgi:hypothetical protein
MKLSCEDNYYIDVDDGEILRLPFERKTNSSLSEIKTFIPLCEVTVPMLSQ